MTYKGYTEARKESNKKYMEKQARVVLWMKPEEKQTLEDRAAAAGKSINQYIKDLVL